VKKLINRPDRVVSDMLAGMALSYPDRLRHLEGTGVIVRRDAPVAGKVGLVSGGGSGHEPAHAGFVGKGMLDAAVAGEVFTSPTPDQILEAIKAVDSGQGVLCIVKNYTGDVLNFEMAAEMAAAEGIDVDHVVVNDDVAVEDSTHTTGRRGIAGTVFVHKVAGARAQAGGTLHEIKQAAQTVIQNVRSIGGRFNALLRFPKLENPASLWSRMKLRSASVFTVNRVWNGQRCERLPTSRQCWQTKCCRTYRFNRETEWQLW